MYSLIFSFLIIEYHQLHDLKEAYVCDKVKTYILCNQNFSYWLLHNDILIRTS